MAALPSVAIAILNWNGKKFLASLLPMLQHLSYPNYTVYVIDNNSSDNSLPFVRTNFSWVKVIALDDNYGFAEGYNLGLAQVSEDFYLITNSDVEVGIDFLQPMVNLMLQDGTFAVVQPKILALNNKQTFEHAGAAGGMIDVLGYPFCRGRIFDNVETDQAQYDDIKQIFWATGTCCLVRRSAYKKVGGMYAYYFMHMEEVDMCWRFNSLGYKVMYCPGSVVYHLGGGSLGYESSRKTYLNFRNNIVMCVRNSPWYVNAWMLPLRMAMDTAAALQFALQKNNANAKAVINAYKEFFKWWFGKSAGKFPAHKKPLNAVAVVFKSSIVWQYYIGKKKKYSDIVK